MVPRTRRMPSDRAASSGQMKLKYRTNPRKASYQIHSIVDAKSFLWTPSKFDQRIGSCASVSVSIFLTTRHR
jgi:hypothetical protein